MRASNQFADVTTGVVYVHASPAAVCPHVEWALSSTLASKANLKWTPQPAMPGQLRAVTNWVGPVGTGARLANALRSWTVLRFEVTEDPSAGVDGQRFCHTPQLGLWSGAMSANGDVMIGEMRLRSMMAAGADALAAELVMDRTTLGRNILPLQRDGLIAVGPGQSDRRSKELRLTRAGLERFAAAQKGWTKAQAQFERAYGTKRAKALRTLLEDVTSAVNRVLL